jgi:hypothetical protein
MGMMEFALTLFIGFYIGRFLYYVVIGLKHRRRM